MVYAFLIHTTDTTGQIIRILYSHCYSPERDETERGMRKDKLEHVSALVQKMFNFQQTASSNKQTTADDLARLTTDGVMPDMKTGLFKLEADDVYSNDMTVVWAAAIDVAYTFTCYPSENVMLARNTLQYIIKCLQDYLNVMSQVEDILTKADWIDLILSHILPQGQLLFSNQKYLKHQEKSLERALSKYNQQNS